MQRTPHPLDTPADGHPHTAAATEDRGPAGLAGASPVPLPSAHSLGRNLVSNLTGAFGARLPSLAILVFLAREGSTGDVGVYTLALSFSTLFNLLLADTSVSMVAVKRVSQDASLTERYLKAMPLANLLIGAIMLVASLAIGTLLYGARPLVWEVVAVLAVSTFVQGLTSGHRWYFKAAQRFDYDSALNWVTGMAMLALGVPLFLATQDVRWYCVGIATGSLAGCLFAIWGVDRLSGYRRSWKASDWSTVRQILVEALPYAASTLVVTATWNIDSVLLAHWRSLEDVGIYGAVLRIVLSLRSISAVILPVLFPLLAYEFQFHSERFRRTFGSALVILCWLGAAIACCLSIAGGGLLKILYGYRYLNGTPILAISGWSIMMSFIASALGVTLIAQHRIRANLGAAVLGLVVQVLGCSLLIPRWGALGCAAAAVITESLIAGLMVVYLRQFLRATASLFWRPMLKIAIAGAATLAAGLLLRTVAVEVRLLLACAIFGLLSWVVRVITPAEWSQLRSLLQGGGPAIATIK